MWNIDQAYIDGAFVPVQGTEQVEIANPATGERIGTATLANRDDAERAIAAARRAQDALARSTRAERIDMLRRLGAAVLARTDRIRDATIEEYGGPLARYGSATTPRSASPPPRRRSRPMPSSAASAKRPS